jgi:transposase
MGVLSELSSLILAAIGGAGPAVASIYFLSDWLGKVWAARILEADRHRYATELAIPGLNASPVPTILSEIGLDPRQWPHAKAFCSWPGLAPHHEISGGTIVRRSTLKPRNRASHALRLAVQAVSRSPNGLGAYDPWMRARQGPKAAIVATAHKIARLVDH